MTCGARRRLDEVHRIGGQQGRAGRASGDLWPALRGAPTYLCGCKELGRRAGAATLAPIASAALGHYKRLDGGARARSEPRPPPDGRGGARALRRRRHARTLHLAGRSGSTCGSGARKGQGANTRTSRWPGSGRRRSTGQRRGDTRRLAGGAGVHRTRRPDRRQPPIRAGTGCPLCWTSCLRR